MILSSDMFSTICVDLFRLEANWNSYRYQIHSWNVEVCYASLSHVENGILLRYIRQYKGNTTLNDLYVFKVIDENIIYLIS